MPRMITAPFIIMVVIVIPSFPRVSAMPAFIVVVIVFIPYPRMPSAPTRAVVVIVMPSKVVNPDIYLDPRAVRVAGRVDYPQGSEEKRKNTAYQYFHAILLKFY